MPAVDDDGGLDGTQCTDHPFRNTSPGGGICAFCLQEKLGKLVSSSSNSSSFFLHSSSHSSSSPSFRSDPTHTHTHTHPHTLPTSSTSTTAQPSTSLALSLRPSSSAFNNINYSSSRKGGGGKIPILLTHKKKNTHHHNNNSISINNNHGPPPSFLKRSKSTATPRSSRYFTPDAEDFSPRRRGFWSFLHLSSKKSSKTTTATISKPTTAAASSTSAHTSSTSAAAVPNVTSVAGREEYVVVVEEDGEQDEDVSPTASTNTTATTATTSFGRKVSRSRSVGCGSRSFSGDFFERISTGFGDCTLRRVESQREGNSKHHRHSTSRVPTGDVIKERVRCGGLFGGFMMITSSSSSSASSSSYWVNDNEHHHGPGVRPGPLIHGRSRSWGWAFASPMRAFNKPATVRDSKMSGPNGGKDGNLSTTTAKRPNLDAIPSLLAVRS